MLTDKQKQVVEICENCGINLNRAKSLVAIHNLTPEVKKYTLNREGNQRYRFNLEKLMHLSNIPAKHQLKVARAAHYHCIITDGLFAPGADGAADFFEAADIDQTQIDRLTETLRHRTLRAMVRRNLIDEPVALDRTGRDYHGGFSLDASVRVESWDRFGLERLLRYCARPTFAEGRLSLAGPDTVVYTLPGPDHQGRSSLTLTPPELIQRLSVPFPPPRKHRHRYAGVLAPNSPLRSRVVPVSKVETGTSSVSDLKT
jgi:hypothetical protein